MRILGVTASGFFEVGDFELISTTILPSAQASVVFDVSSFSSDYKHLQIRTVTRSTRATSGDFSFMRINSDTTNSYARHQLYGTGSSVLSFALSSINYMALGGMPSANGATGAFGSEVIDILDAFSTTKNKTVRSLGGALAQPVFDEIAVFSNGYFKTDAVSTLTFSSGNGASYAAGSRFSIYGLRG
jgi:hypothetical protein